MKKLLVFLLLIAAIIWMFKHPEEMRTHSTQAAAKLSRFFGSLAGEELSQSPAGPLPEGMYCLVQPVRFDFAGGSTVQPAGILVRKTGDGGNGRMLVTDELGTAVIDSALATRDPAIVSRVQEQSRLAARSAPATGAAAAKHLQEIETKLASLRAELESIERRDYVAQRTGQKVQFATSVAFVRNAIITLEQQKASALARQKAAQGSMFPSAQR